MLTDPKQTDLEELIAEAKARAAQSLDDIMSESETLAAAVIKRLEQADITASPSPGVLRKKVYEVMAACGINVPRLVEDQRNDSIRRAQSRIRHMRIITTMAQRREAAGLLTAKERSELETKLLDRDKRIAEYQETITTYLKRPKAFSHAPTEQRRSHANENPKVIATVPHAGISSPKAHRFEGVMEHCRTFMFASQAQAVERFIAANEQRSARPGVGNYGQRAGRSNSWDRDGITSTQLKAAEMWRYLETRIPPPLWKWARELFLDTADAKSASDWAKPMVATKDGRVANGAWRGLAIALAVVLDETMRSFDARRAQERQQSRAAR